MQGIWIHTEVDHVAFTNEKYLAKSIRITFSGFRDVEVSLVESTDTFRRYKVSFTDDDGKRIEQDIAFRYYQLYSEPTHL